MKALETFIKQARFLIVDDEITNVCLLEETLIDEGLNEFVSTTDSRKAVELFREYQPDIVLLDLMMPYLNGFEVLDRINSLIPPDQLVPVIILTADITPATRNRALKSGARDFLTKPLDPDELILRCRNLLEMRHLHIGLEQQKRKLEARIEQTSVSLETTLEELKLSRSLSLYQDRLHVFAEMTGGVIHDFNNCLSILKGYSDLLQMEGMLDDPGNALEMLGHMSTAASDAAGVVGRLRHFYNPDKNDDKCLPEDLSGLLKEAADLSRMKWEAGAAGSDLTIDLRFELDHTAPLLCNAAQVREMFINVIFNAIDAMPSGGIITLRSIDTESGVHIEIEDTGIGMPEEIRLKCLDPFFSTKGEKGTGLGLAMVNRIVAEHGGTLSIRSRTGEGTVFLIDLPRSANRTGQTGMTLSRIHRPLRILFAEDNDSVREVVRRFLEADGHSVTAVANGWDASNVFSPDHHDLVVTDLSMPRMNGESLADHIKAISPATPVIMITGFDSLMLPGGSTPASVDSLRSKPVSRNDLNQAISEAFAAQGLPS